MKITLTLTLTENDARKLWDAVESEQAPYIDDATGLPIEEGCPTGQELADWAGQHAADTLESNWQFDSGVFPAIMYGAEIETADILRAILALDEIIGTGDSNTREVSIAKAERADLEDDLGLSDEPETHDNQLTALFKHYGIGQGV